MSNLYTLSMKLDQEFINDQNEAEDPTYTGIIANKNLTTYNTHLSSQVLRGFAKSAREGVMVLANHNRGQIVGRSTSGTFANDDQVTSSFYIQRGLEFAASPLFGSSGYATTDDYIKAINRGTYTDISVGFKNHTEICDFCGEEIKGGFFYSADKNGHYPGQKIYVDKSGTEYDEDGRGRKEVLITATITTGDLFEYSLVDIGALPGAEIVKQAQLMQLEPKHKHYMLHRYGFNIDEPGDDYDKYFSFGKLYDLLPSGKSFSFPHSSEDNKMATKIIDPADDKKTAEDKLLTQTDEQTITELQAQLGEAQKKNAKYDIMETEKEEAFKALGESQEVVKTLTAENKELLSRVSELEVITDEYNAAFTTAKEEAKKEYIRMSGAHPDMESFNDIMKGINRLSTLDSLARKWRIQGDARLGTSGSTTVSSEPVVVPVDPYTYDPQDYI